MNKEEHKIKVNGEIKEVKIEYDKNAAKKITIEDFNLIKTPERQEIIKK